MLKDAVSQWVLRRYLEGGENKFPSSTVNSIDYENTSKSIWGPCGVYMEQNPRGSARNALVCGCQVQTEVWWRGSQTFSKWGAWCTQRTLTSESKYRWRIENGNSSWQERMGSWGVGEMSQLRGMGFSPIFRILKGNRKQGRKPCWFFTVELHVCLVTLSCLTFCVPVISH